MLCVKKKQEKTQTVLDRFYLKFLVMYHHTQISFEHVMYDKKKYMQTNFFFTKMYRIFFMLQCPVMNHYHLEKFLLQNMLDKFFLQFLVIYH